MTADIKWRWVGMAVISIVLLLPVQFGAVRVFNEAALLLALLLVVTALLVGKTEFSPLDGAAAMVALAFSCVFVLVTLTHPGQPSVPKDLLEAGKPLLYAALFVIGAQCQRATSSESIRRAIVAVAIISVAHSALVFVPVLYPFVDLWKGRPSTSVWNFHFQRFSGTLAYPDILGMWLVLALMLVFDDWVHRRGAQIGNALKAGTIATGLLLTGSRGALVVGVVSCGAYLLLSLRALGARRAAFISVCAAASGALVGLVVLNAELAAASYFRQGIAEGASDGSLLHRLREFGLLVDAWQSGNILGSGPQNAYLASSFGPVESGIFYYAYKFGVVGVSFLVVLLVLLAWFVKNRGSSCVLGRPFGVWGIVSVVVGGVSMSITEEYKSFLIFFFLLGACAREQVTQKVDERP